MWNGIDLRTGIICDELPEISDCQTNKWGRGEQGKGGREEQTANIETLKTPNTEKQSPLSQTEITTMEFVNIHSILQIYLFILHDSMIFN